jgi:hypothetical protein
MMHPDTELKIVSAEIGVGVFATRSLPKGTIVYVEDPLEINIPSDSAVLLNPVLRPLIDKFGTIRANGDFEISWDYAKYMNHCCRYNAITTGFGFDIATEDIHAGEQIRDDYGLFNVEYGMELMCDFADCRKRIRTQDFDSLADGWDRSAIDALAHSLNVPQKLWEVIDPELRARLTTYLETGRGYVSVRSLKRQRTEDEADPV